MSAYLVGLVLALLLPSVLALALVLGKSYFRSSQQNKSDSMLLLSDHNIDSTLESRSPCYRKFDNKSLQLVSALVENKCCHPLNIWVSKLRCAACGRFPNVCLYGGPQRRNLESCKKFDHKICKCLRPAEALASPTS